MMADIKSTANNTNKLPSNCLSDGPGSMCKVCGDRASGKHYGVPSCDGCRGFFKRSIRRNLEYICKEGGKCTVDVSRRNQCQACRFAKCLQANMRREAVQHERAPRTCIGGAGVTQMNTHHHHHNIGGIPIDVYAAAAHSRRFPLHSNGIILPLPIHINTFSSFDQSRFIVPPVNQINNNRNNIDHNNNTTIIDAFQFGNGVFTPPSTFSSTSISMSGVATPSTVNASTTSSSSPSPLLSLNPSALTNTELTNSTAGGSIKKMNKLNYFTNDNIFGHHNSIINDHFSPNLNRRYYPSNNNIIINNSSVSTIPTATIAKDDNEVSSSAEEIPLSADDQHHHHHHHIQSTNLSNYPHYNNNDINQNDNENSSNNEALFETAAKLLFLSVKWAKTTPSFSQINSKDQKLLLEESWAELFVITSAQYGLSIDVITTKDLRVHRLQKIINQIVFLRLDQTESACLKALILFRPDCYGLGAVHQVSMLQEQTLNLLLDKCGGIRASHLLLTLPCIRSAADPQLLQELLFKRTVGEVAIERLLGDLIRN